MSLQSSHRGRSPCPLSIDLHSPADSCSYASVITPWSHLVSVVTCGLLVVEHHQLLRISKPELQVCLLAAARNLVPDG